MIDKLENCVFEKSVVTLPFGKSSPNEFSTCIIFLEPLTRINSEHSYNIQFNSKYEIIVGLADAQLKYILDLVLYTMKEGERSMIACNLNLGDKYNSFVTKNEILEEELSSDDLLFKKNNSCLPNFKFFITLLNLKYQENIFHLESSHKLERALKLKEHGITAFQNTDYVLAFFNFSRALKYILGINYEESINKLQGDSKLESINENAIISTDRNHTSLRLQLYLNLAICQLKTDSNIAGALENSKRALLLDRSSAKGWFRRAEANLKLGNYQSAIEDFNKALELNPNDKYILNELKKSKELYKDSNKFLGIGLKEMFK